MAEFTPEEMDNIIGAFKTLGVKPKADTPDDFAAWMVGYVSSVKEEIPITTGPDPSFPPTDPPVPPASSASPAITVSQPLRICTFSGDAKTESSYDLWRFEVRTGSFLLC